MSSQVKMVHFKFPRTDLPGYNGCVETPILVEDAMYLIKAESGYSIFYLYTISSIIAKTLS